VIELEKTGFVLWEGITLLMVIFGGIGMVALRRRASGRPAFTYEDRQLFFGRSRMRLPTPRLLFNFGVAIVLCFFSALLEVLILAPLGAGLLTVVLLLTSLGIVNKLLG
jgi:hypothetical protein